MTLFQSLRAKISIIIPVYNGGQPFRRCLGHLFALNPAPFEIIVVADGDTDGSRDLAREFGAKVLVNPTCQGPAHARNVGARHAQGDILFFVDADVALPPDALTHIICAFSECRGNPLRTINPTTLAALIGSYDDEPAVQNFLSQYKNLLHHYVHQTSCEDASTFWGACGAIRRDVFLAVGGFDDQQYERPSIEDIELGYRLKRAGYRIRLVKGLQVKHLKRWSAFSLIKTDFFQRALPWTELILRDRHIVNDLNLQTSSRISVALTFALIGTLPLARRLPVVRAIMALLACGLLALNAPAYRFFWRKRGLLFTLQAIIWHWLYYFYSGLAFSIVFARYWWTGQPQGIAPTR